MSNNQVTPNLSLLTTLKEQSQLYDLHTHLLGMGNAGFWVDTILMNPNIMPENSEFFKNKAILCDLCPLIWYEDEKNMKFGFVDGDKAASFFYYLTKNSKLPKVDKYKHDNIIENIKKQFQFSKLSLIQQLEYDSELSQESLHRGLNFHDNFSFDVVLRLDHLCKALGIKPTDNHDLKQIAVTEKLGIYSSIPSVDSPGNSLESSVKFCDWIIFNACEQKFEIVYGIQAADLRRLITLDVNAPLEGRRLARAHIINAFSMCNAEGTPARNIDLQSFHGLFTPEFYPRRFALKDSIYFQRLDVLAALIIHALERYQGCLPPIKYCELSISSNGLSRACVFDVLRSFPANVVTSIDSTGEILEASNNISSFSQMVFYKKRFSYLKFAYKLENNGFRCKYDVIYKFLAGFNRQQVELNDSKKVDHDAAIRLLTDYPHIAILKMVTEMQRSGKSQETIMFAPFVNQLKKLQKKIEQRPSFYDWVVGLDLFGDELGYPYCPFVAHQFIKYVKTRQRDNPEFGLRIHGGENVIYADNDSSAYRFFIAHMYIVFRSLQFLQNKLKGHIRIGHGIAFDHILGENMNKLMHRKSSVLLAEMQHHAPSLFKQIAFEINITSNEYLLGQTLRQGDFVRTLRLDALFREKIPIILATDDDGIWPIDQCSCVHPGHQSLAAEYCRAISSGLIRTDDHLQTILQSTKKFCFWKRRARHISSPNNGGDTNDNDGNITCTVITRPDVIQSIYKLYTNETHQNTNFEFKDLWAQLSGDNPFIIREQNDVDDGMRRVAFICICASPEFNLPKNKICKEYINLFDSKEHFSYIYDNWQEIRTKFMSTDSTDDSSILSHRVCIEDESLHAIPTNISDVQATIHAFGPNMINNENIHELECFEKLHPNYIKKISLVICTNNDKNAYHYDKFGTSSTMVINPSARATNTKTFLYVLCKHASAATAALHCIYRRIRPFTYNTRPKRCNLLDVFDSEMTSQMVFSDGCHTELKLEDNLKKVLEDILQEQHRRVQCDPQNSTQKDLMEALCDHRQVFRALNFALKYLQQQSIPNLTTDLQDDEILDKLCAILNRYDHGEGTIHFVNILKAMKITELNLSHRIKDEGIKHFVNVLKENVTLKKLHLGWNEIKDQAVEKLVNALTTRIPDGAIQHEILLELDLRHNAIGDRGAQSLSNALMLLKKLDLAGNQIGDDGTKHLAHALKINKTLITLDISRNEIGDEGAKQLAEALKTNKKLVHLHLYRNRIRDIGVECLAEGLGENQTLKDLHLGWNIIRDDGAKYLADVLKKNKTLTTLDIGGNQITDKGAKFLANALENNTELIELDVCGNEIGDKGIEDLIKKLDNDNVGSSGIDITDETSKTKIQILRLGGNQIGDKGVAHFADVLRKKRGSNFNFYYMGNQIGEAAEKRLCDALNFT